jgi:hypothetical protein
MARDKKKSKGPQHRNGNYQLKNGNKPPKKQQKKAEGGLPVQTKSAAAASSGEQKSFFSGISSRISSATSSLTKMFKRN